MPFVCPTCGQEGRFQSKKRCSECYGRSCVESYLQKFLPTLQHQFARDLCEGFCHDFGGQQSYTTARHRVRKYFPFFMDLDDAFVDVTNVSKASILDRFNTRWIIRWESPLNYLQKMGVLLLDSSEEIREVMVKEQVDKIIEQHEGWVRAVLQDYLQYLYGIRERYRSRGWHGKRSRFKPRTILALFRAATAFLDSLGEDVSVTTQIEQIHVDSFLFQKSGYRACLPNFLGYLKRKRKVFRPLKVTSPLASISSELILGYERYLELVQGWLDPEKNNLKESLLCILLALYGQTPLKAVGIELADVEVTEGKPARIKFAKNWLSLTPEVTRLLERYLVERQTRKYHVNDKRNQYLFPGRKYGHHTDHLTFREYFEKYRVTGSQLFSSCMLYLFASGIRSPKALVDGFGITVSTAMRYFELVNERGGKEVAWSLYE